MQQGLFQFVQCGEFVFVTLSVSSVISVVRNVFLTTDDTDGTDELQRALEFPRKRLVQQGLFQFVQCGEFAMVILSVSSVISVV